MSESHQPEQISLNNEQSIRTLARAITYSQGEFSLLLVRCNYASLRKSMIQKLRQQCAVEIQELELLPNSKTLYTAISNEINGIQPSALVVFGLEAVHSLDAVLASTNQVREEFRKAFAFPLVLWINDTILKKLIKQVPDLESWASVIEFEMPPNSLIGFLQGISNRVFEELLDVGSAPFLSKLSHELGSDSVLSLELGLAQQDLQQQGIELEAELASSLQFLLGLSKASAMKESRQHYERSLALWPSDTHVERQGCVYYQLGLWHRTYAVQNRSEYDSSCLQAVKYYQKALTTFERVNRPELLARFINPMGEALQRLKKWEDLEPLARKSLSLNETDTNLYRQAEASGLLAESLLGKSVWAEAKQVAEQALQALEAAIDAEPAQQSEEQQGYIDWQNLFRRGWYLFALGRAQWSLDQRQDAIDSLETARRTTRPELDPLLFIQLLRTLRQFYYEQKDYLKAFETRLEYRSLEQQYGFRAFVGAGRLQPQRDIVNPALVNIQTKQQDKVSQEISASGRQESINQLIERLSRADQKLIVVHGQSGVGKSSLIQAGLIPSLTPITLDTREVIAVLQQVYTNWTQHLGREMLKELKKLSLTSLPEEVDSSPVILEQLRKSVAQNLMVVLIFDQFEEFFFVHKEPAERKPFYEFLQQCLDIPYVKVILSLREDYLHYLLECNDRLVSLDIIGNNILDKNILFHLGNFTRKEAKTVIQKLTKETPYPLNTDLTNELVEDLSEELGEVRPIELQVVGSQLQTEQITTLTQYQEKGPKDALVSRFLDEVTHDCGPENEEIARLVLYLLTDENNTRPLKTREDIELEINVAGKLELILTILVKSGLVFRIPSSPSDRYQLVHDYLVIFVRQTQSTQLIAELEKEREQRQLTEKQLNEALQKQLRTARRATFTLVGLATAVTGVALFASFAFTNAIVSSKNNSSAQNSELTRVLSALDAGKLLKKLPGVMNEIQLKTLSELNQAVSSAQITNEIKAHEDEITDISLSQDGQLVASSSKDKTVVVWHLNGSKKPIVIQHASPINCLEFSPNSKLLVTGTEKGVIRLWDIRGNLVKEFSQKHSDGVSSIAFSPNGDKIISGSESSNLKVWNQSGELIKSLDDHETEILGIRFNDDGSKFATFAEFDRVIVWNTESIEKIGELESYNTFDLTFKDTPNSVEIANIRGLSLLFNLNGKLLGGRFLPIRYIEPNLRDVSFFKQTDFIAHISNFEQKVIRLESETSNRSIRLTHTDRVTDFEFDTVNHKIVSADASNRLTVWDVSEIKKYLNEDENKKYENINSLKLTPNLKHIFLNTASDTIVIDKNGPNIKLDESLLLPESSLVSLSLDGTRFITINKKNLTQKNWVFDSSQIHLDSVATIDSGNSDSIESGLLNAGSRSFSQDGELTVTGDKNGFIKLWASDGKLLFEKKAHKQKIISLAISPDKQKIVSASSTALKVLDVKGNLLNEFGYSNNADNSRLKIIFSSDSQKFISLQNGLAKLWFSNGTLKAKLFGHPGPVVAADFSPNGETILTVSVSKQYENSRSVVNLWESDGSLKYSVPISNGGYSTRFSPDGEEIYSYEYSSESVSRISVTGQSLKSLEGHVGRITNLVYSNDGNFIATSSEDGTIRLWDRNGTLSQILRGHGNSVTGIDIAPDSQTIVSSDTEGMVKLWTKKEVNAFTEIKQYHSPYFENTRTSVAFLTDGINIALQGSNYNSPNYISVIDISGKEIIAPQLGQFINLSQLGSNSNSKRLISIHQNHNLELRSTNGNLLATLEGHTAQINSVSFSPDGQRIASASNDQQVMLWERDGSLLDTIDYQKPVNSVSFSSDGKLLAVASDEKIIKIFDSNGKPVLDQQGNRIKLTGHTDSVSSVLFSPDGKILASASNDNTIRLWNVDTWQQEEREIDISDFHQGPNNLDSLWFSEDGSILAYGTEPVYVRFLNKRFLSGIRVTQATFYPIKDIFRDDLPDSSDWLTVRGNKGAIILSLGLDHSLRKACEWSIDYLNTNDQDHLCKGILQEDS